MPKARSSAERQFKRHELEHVRKYYCVSKWTRLEIETPSGNQCVFCRHPNPGRAHFSRHGLDGCLARDEAVMFTRRDNFKNHLKAHTISRNDLATLFKMCTHDIAKTAFACGSCVAMLFDTKEKQIFHILNQHGRGMQDWDETRILRSLVRHPQVNPAWNNILDSYPQVNERLLSWPRECGKNAKVRLELDLSSESPEEFAHAAFHAAQEDPLSRHMDDTRRPLQVASSFGDTTMSSPNQLQRCQAPSLSLRMPNVRVDQIKSINHSRVATHRDGDIATNPSQQGVFTSCVPPVSPGQNVQWSSYSGSRSIPTHGLSSQPSAFSIDSSFGFMQTQNEPPETTAYSQLSIPMNASPNLYTIDEATNTTDGSENYYNFFPGNYDAESATGYATDSPESSANWNVHSSHLR